MEKKKSGRIGRPGLSVKNVNAIGVYSFELDTRHFGVSVGNNVKQMEIDYVAHGLNIYTRPTQGLRGIFREPC